jgi:hypothetical protein
MKGQDIVRRSVTVNPDLNLRISQLRALCLQNGMDLDYTSALNLLAELGERWLEISTKADREKYREVWSKYVDFDRFERFIISDWKEYEEFRKWKLKAKEETSRS